LHSVTIGNGVKKIGTSVFSNCYSLASVTVGAAVKTIDSYAFYGCDNLTIYGYTGSYTEEYSTNRVDNASAQYQEKAPLTQCG